MASWRYQVVIEVEEDGAEYLSLCEVHFDDQDRLNGWSENASMAPSGETAQELSNDLVHMLTDMWSWRPVRFSEMRPGMTFTRALSVEQRGEIADMFDVFCENAERAQKALN